VKADKQSDDLNRLRGWMEALVAYVRSTRVDLTNRQMALLMLVYLTPGPHTVRGLAGQLQVSKPVVTRALNTLGALGYLKRRKDERDLRNVLVDSTESGRAFLASFAALIEKGSVTRNVDESHPQPAMA
jgi:DNA-binding MarR family transcriptional regulator